MGKIKTLLKRARFQLVEYWDKPRPGEYLSNKEFGAYCLAASGIGLTNYMGTAQGFAFGINTIFCGAIMRILPLDFINIGVIGMILGYVFMLFSPLNMLIYENHGKIGKSKSIIAHIINITLIICAIIAYSMPSDMFKDFMVGAPQILGNSLIIFVFNFYTDWTVRRFFGAKYGRIKPFIIIYAIPIFLLYVNIAFIDPNNTTYLHRLILLHLLFCLTSTMVADIRQTNPLVTFISPNSQERQRLFSYAPIITYLLPSIIGIFYPLIVGNHVDQHIVFKIAVPIFGAIGMGLSFFVIKCKERVIEDKSENRNKVEFLQSLKEVYSDKYLWLDKIHSIFNQWFWAFPIIISWWFIYTLKTNWMSGLVATITTIPITFANLISPSLTKKFYKKHLIVVLKTFNAFILFITGLTLLNNMIVPFIILTTLRNFTNCIETNIMIGLTPDVMDRHQWKYGRRCDSTAGTLGWIFMPVVTVIGFVLPMLLKYCGFTNDWSVLFNKSVAYNVYKVYIYITIVGTLLGLIPYLFYNITKQKHDKYIREIKERLKAIEIYHGLEKMQEERNNA